MFSIDWLIIIFFFCQVNNDAWLQSSSALEYNIIRHDTHVVYYYYLYVVKLEQTLCPLLEHWNANDAYNAMWSEILPENIKFHWSTW